MLQIRGMGYTREDYETLKRVLVLGTKAFHCEEQLCESCPQKRLCSDVSSTIEYCNKKVKGLSSKC